MPFHFSYLHWLAGFSEPLARGYFAAALRSCDVAGVAPSLLLHPLDFLGRDDVSELAFFPGMDQPAAEKIDRMHRLLAGLSGRYTVHAMGDFAGAIAGDALPLRRPDFRQPRAGGTDTLSLEAEGR
jgi:hypothetical protein